MQKFKLNEPMVLRHLEEYLMDNIANLTSPHKTSVQLAQNKIATSHVTAANYIDHLTRAYLLNPVKRYDIRGKKYLATNEKCDIRFLYDIAASVKLPNMGYSRHFKFLQEATFAIPSISSSGRLRGIFVRLIN